MLHSGFIWRTGPDSPPVSTCPLVALQGGYLLPSPNSQTAETKVSRRDDFPVAMPAKPAWAVHLQRRKQKYGERNIPQKHAPECEAPFTPATVYRLALVGDKPKKRVTFQ